MGKRLSWGLLIGAIAVMMPPDAWAQDWKDKPVAKWTASDAQIILADSPWTKSLTAMPGKPFEKKAPADRKARRSGSHATTAPPESPQTATQDPVKLLLRWETALPVREARLKTKDPLVIPLDDGHYAVAVYGIPKSVIVADGGQSARQLKSGATLKCLGKNVLKPSRVEILLPESGPVVVYYFSRNIEITWRDRKIDFAARVGLLKFTQAFDTGEMILQGKLEL